MAELEDGRTLVPRMRVADTFWTRFMGLMGQRIGPDQGLLLRRCQAIHCGFMRMPIDVLFLDPTGAVVHVIHQMRPWAVSKAVRRAQDVLEMYPGIAKQMGVDVGTRIVVRET